MNKKMFLFLALMVSIIIGTTPLHAQATMESEPAKTPVIVDTDMGFDDKNPDKHWRRNFICPDK